MPLLSRLIITLALVTAIFSDLKSQHLSATLSAGVGESYIIERLAQNGYPAPDYRPSYALKSGLNYHFDETYFDLGLSVIRSSTAFLSVQGCFGTFAKMNSTSVFLNARHLNTNKKVNLGYSFGLGISHERNAYYATSETFNHGKFTFASFNTSGILSYNVSKRISILLEPTLIWADINHTFSPDKWLFGREDLHFLTHLGIEYRFGN